MMGNWLEALSDYLEEFSAEDIRRGFHLYREKAVTQVSRASSHYLVNLVNNGRYTLQYQLENGKCRGYICPDSGENHRAMLYAGALELHKQLMGNREIPENQDATTRLRGQDEQLRNWLAQVRKAQPHQRLSTTQQAYLTAVWELFRRLTPHENLQPRQLQQIEKTFQPRNLKPFDFWQIKPSDVAEFWQYFAYGLQQHGHPVPEFLQKVTDTSAIHRQVTRHARRLHIQRWRQYIDQSQSQELLSQAQNTDMRLVIGSKLCRWEIREPGREDFEELRRDDFLTWHAREEDGHLRLSPSAMALWPHLASHWQRAEELHMNLTRGSTAHRLNRILQDPRTHPHLIFEDGRELVFEDIPLGWQCRQDPENPEGYLLEMIDGHGAAAPAQTLHLPGVTPLYLWDNHVFHGPPPLDFHPRYPCNGKVPRDIIETAAGLIFLDSLGAPPPNELLDRLETRDYEIHIRAKLEIASRGRDKDFERVCLEVTACEPRSGRRECLGPAGWETLARGKLPEYEPGADADNNHPLLHFRQAHKKECVRLLQNLGARPRHKAAGWVVRLQGGAEERLTHWLRELPAFMITELTGELASLESAPIEADLRLDVKPRGIDWLDLEISLETESLDIAQDDLQRLLEARGELIRLPGKGWRRLQLNLDEQQAAHLETAGIQPWSSSKSRRRLHVLSVSQPGFEVLFNSNDWSKILERREHFLPREPMDLPDGLEARLRAYQKEGFDFLCYLTRNNFGGILADDMGLGKTVQTLAWLLWLQQQQQQQQQRQKQQSDEADPPFTALIVCPKSVMNAWQTEIRNFAPGLSDALYEPGDLRNRRHPKADLCIANYTQLRLHQQEFQNRSWSAVILDEAQYIKSPNSATARAAFSLKAENRLALTGTPIENRLMDIWSIMNFAMPGVLGSRTHFAKFYDQNRSAQVADNVRKRLRPFLLRRTKEEAARDLPDRLTEVLTVRMEDKQQELYDAELREARRALLKIESAEDFQQQRFSILRSLTRLRQICCHPHLLFAQSRGRLRSAKLERLLEMVTELLEEGHKVLIFSQFVSMLDLMREQLADLGAPYLYLTGRSENRGAIVESFQETSEPTVFLLSLRAAGAGINLNTASYVFLYDPWWNPAVEEQAINRAHRIGTRNNIIIYRLVAENSIEEKMQDLKFVKSTLASQVIDEDANQLPDKLSLEDLRDLLGPPEEEPNR